jgi:REP element-mobilizing transposase RayT
MRYRRADVTGGTYFFTVNLAERSRTLLVDHVDTLRQVVRLVKAKHPFHIDAMVILPDHLHAVWTLPPGDCDYPTRWMLIKASFSRRIPAGERRNKSRMTKGERGIWQRRYWEHVIRDEARVGWGECNEPQHLSAVRIALGFLRHRNLRLEDEMNAVLAGRCDRWDLFLHHQSGRTEMDED